MKLGVNGRFYGARPTGVQRFAREMVQRLARLEDVTIFLPASRGPVEGLPDGARLQRGRLAGKLWEQVELPRRAAEVDLVLHPANVAPLHGPPGVIVLHDPIPFTHPGAFRPLYGTWARAMARAGAERSRAVVTVSRWSADELSRALRIPRDRFAVVTQGVAPLDHPASDDAVRAVARRHGLARPYFLAVVGTDPRKGADLLLEAWRDPGAPDADLVLVGGAHRAVHAASAPIGSLAVRALGPVDDEDLRALYTGARALLFPSRAEGFGRPPLEAMACGTRALVAEYGPAAEVLGDAAPILPRDPRIWAAAARDVLREPAEARADSVARGAAWAARFTWEAAAAEVAAVCRRCGGTP